MNQTKDNGKSLDLKRIVTYDPTKRCKLMTLDAMLRNYGGPPHACITELVPDVELRMSGSPNLVMEWKWQEMEYKLREYIGDRPDTDYQI